MVRNVAVFFGGKSAEREISVLTGVLALKTIDPALYQNYMGVFNGSGNTRFSFALSFIWLYFERRKLLHHNFLTINDVDTTMRLGELLSHDVIDGGSVICSCWYIYSVCGIWNEHQWICCRLFAF